MRIVEIGHTGVGKTTYMAAMYGILHDGIEDFGLRASDSKEHKRLIKLAKNIRKGEYPAPTDQRSNYNFYLQYQGKDIFRFLWVDHRGGAVRETQDSKQARLLLRDLKEADGVLMFCDCEALVSGDNRSNQIGRMIALMNNALQSLDRPLAIAIVLTKADLVDNLSESDLEPFSGLLQAIQASDSISGGVIPVACGARSINVELPVLFALQMGVNLLAYRLKKEMDEHQEMAEYYEQQTYGFGGFLREVWDEFQGNETFREKAQARYQKAFEKYKEVEPIIEPVEALNKYLSSGL